jgi:hypothetical protein
MFQRVVQTGKARNRDVSALLILQNIATLVRCPTLLHNLTNFAVVLALVLAVHPGCFRIRRRIWIRVAQQGLQSQPQQE